MNKYISNLSITGIALVIAACGGGGNNNNGNVNDDDDNIEIVEEDVTIRGVIDTILPSVTLPSNAIASNSLPSYALPSNSLPSIEVDESPVAIAEVRTLNITLQKEQEVSVSPLADGNVNLKATAEVVVNETTGAITATVTATDLDVSDEITMVHIHSGFAGSNGPVIAGLTATADPLVFTLDTTLAATGSDLETFLSGGWYLNLHTASNPGGQLRGQIFTNDADVVRVEMSSEQEVTIGALPEIRSTSGVGYFTYDTDTANDSIIANLQTFGFEGTVVHIHAGIAGQNGPVIIGLDDVSDTVNNASTGTFWSTDPSATFVNRANTLNGGYYFNAHSAANPGGEVRGQILPGDATVERVVLQTAQEVPAVVTPAAANVGGVAYVTTNGDNFIGANVQVDGFTPFLDAPIGPVHIHTAFAGDTGPVAIVLDEVAINDAEGNAVEDTFYRATAASSTATAFDPADFNAGRNYINIHSAANAAGEIRGQITPANTQAVRVVTSANQELAPVSDANPDAAGIGYVTINQTASETTVVANARTSGFEAVEPGPGLGAVHLHDAFAGENGGIVVTLDDTAGSGDDVTQGSFFVSNSGVPVAIPADDVEDFLNGGYYFNIHSAENVPGELRGQVTPNGVQTLISTLQGQQENPPIVNAAGISGTGFVTVNTNNSNVVANVRVAGFIPELDAPIGPVHIHNGFAGENGGVLLPLLPLDGSDVNYRGTQENILPGQALDLARLLSGGNYINVHSAANASGELRGQLISSGVEAVRMELQGQQENPPVENAEGISGVAYATFNAEKETIVLNSSVVGFVPELNAPIGPVHLHNAFAGANGPVILPLSPVDGSEVNYRGTEADILSDVSLDFDQLSQGAYYINIHSAANASGELRGQLVTSNSRVLRAELDGSQVLPSPVDTSATGIGYLTVTDFANGLFLSNVTLTGLEDATVSVNVGGANNIQFNDLIEVDEDSLSFNSPVGPVRSLNGIINGAYSFQATGEVDDDDDNDDDEDDS